MGADIDLVELFRAELELCRVKPAETLAVLTEGAMRQDYAAAFLGAAEQLGAVSYQVNVPRRSVRPGAATKLTSLSGHRPAIESLKRVDMVVDLIGLLWSAEQQEILKAGPRMLMCLEPVEVILRMFPTAELRRRVEAAAALLAGAKDLRVMSDAGTDVVYRLGSYPVITQYGFTDTPGRWDNCPGGFLYTGGHDQGVDGTVVLDSGDMIFPFRRYVTDPIRLTVERGRVTRIDGAGLDCELLRNYMARFHDERAYAVSHIGWGMDEKASWDFFGTSPLASSSRGCDGRAFYGNVLFSTGPNAELGGANDTACHLDLPLRGCDLFLDGRQIIKKGDILPDALRVDARAAA